MSGRRTASIVAAFAALTFTIGACSLTGVASVEVAVGDLPGLVMECRGDPVLTGTVCLDWARDVIAEHPEEAADAARIVLTDREGAGRCLADFQDVSGAIYASVNADCPA